MRAAERSGEINRRRDSDSPDDCDLENADLRARCDGGAYATAAEENKNERSEEFTDRPFRKRRVGDFDFRRNMWRRFRARRSNRLAHIKCDQQQPPPSQQTLASVVAL